MGHNLVLLLYLAYKVTTALGPCFCKGVDLIKIFNTGFIIPVKADLLTWPGDGLQTLSPFVNFLIE